MLMQPERVNRWILPKDIVNENAYGLWNCLIACNENGDEIDIIRAHDGDFFPESPFDYVDMMRNDLLSGEKGSKLWPVRVDIDVNQDCSDHCYFCYSRPYSGKKTYKHASISEPDFRCLIAQLAESGTKTIRFTGGGEPLLHPDIRTLLTIPASFDLNSCIITNGTMLNKELCDIIVEHVDHLRISINAATNETRKKLHRTVLPGNQLDQIFDLLHHITTRRKALQDRQRKPLIWATFLITHENISEISACAKAMKMCGIDSLSYRPIYHGFTRDFSECEWAEIRRQFELASEFHDPPSFFLFFPKRDVQHLYTLNPHDYFDRCLSCTYRTIIEASNFGSFVQKCWVDRGNPDKQLGQLCDKTLFREIWNQFIRTSMKIDPGQNCKSCIDISMNNTLHGIGCILKEDPKAVFYKGNIVFPDNQM